MKYLILLLAFVLPLHAQPTLANSDDITAAKARANHTGTQLMSTISDAGTAATSAKMGVFLQPTTPQLFSRVAAVGDSITDGLGTASLTYNHYIEYLKMLSKGKVSTIQNDDERPTFSTAGAASSRISAMYLDKLLVSNAEAIVVLAGTNDYQIGRTAAEVVATLTNMADRIIQAGKTPIICEVLPVPSTHGTADKPTWVAGVNSALTTAMASRPAAIFCDWADSLDSNGDGLATTDAYFTDSVHPDVDAMAILGPYLYNKCSAYIRPATDALDGTTWVSPNPTMTGTVGTPQVATGWNVDAGSGKTVTNTITAARAGSLGNWQQIAMSGTDTSITILRYGFGTASGGFAVGDRVELVVEFEMDSDCSPMAIISPQLYTDNGSGLGYVVRRTANTLPGGIAYTTVGRVSSGVIVSEPYILPSGCVGVWPYISIIGTGTVRIGRCGLRKLATKTPVDQPLTGNIIFQTSGRGIKGTATNDSATALNVGEFIQTLVATGAAVSLTTATAANVGSISLTAGDWDVQGAVNINAGSATLTTFSAGISATSATVPTDGSEVSSGLQLTTTTAIDGITLPRKRISISTTTTIYLVARSTFSAGTVAAFGQINARRVR